jgi:hypothetical protein
MKKILRKLGVIATSLLILVSCQTNEPSISKTSSNGVSEDVLLKIENLGFSTQNVIRTEDGYLVEGDINLTDELLNGTNTAQLLRAGNEEQYRTTNLVTRLPRVVTVIVNNLGSAYIQGADLAISRYNSLGLDITFKRITSGKADITIKGFYQGPSGGYITLGSAGFPTSNGSPYRSISLNTHEQAYGSNPDYKYVGSVIQHEMGHCIGFRHTDYMNRSYSCNGDPVNEGASNVGAVHIPGTPTGPDANSWMLACSNGGDRTIKANDVTALKYLY